MLEAGKEQTVKNPLMKRVPREFLGELGKYIVIFLFMAATIGFVSGFLVAGGSMIKAYDDSFDKYNIEDGHFVTEEKISSQQIERIEEEDVTIYPDFYLEEETDHDNDGKADSTLRIFTGRTNVNKVCLMEGSLPAKKDEIAIDRMYADNNKITVGDSIKVGKREVTVTGLIALSDYSALFSDNNDLMFDAVKFGVSIMTKEGFEDAANGKLHYSYSWKYGKDPKDEIEEKEMSDAFMEALNRQVLLKDYVPRYSNQAINFTGDDMGGDKAMMIVLLYILIVILAFVFSVTINHTITREASVIGTLRASGYTKGELLFHYMAAPMMVTLLAAIMGNILGYTWFKNIVVQMYYGSYSLPTYTTIWNGEAFVLTTVIPMIIMLLTNIFSLARKLNLSPLRFIRHDLSHARKKKAVRLPNFKFFHRFRLRIIIQNIASYLTLFIGIIFANILLLFGMMMSPLLAHFQDEVLDHMLAKYQYVLKVPFEINDESAEKFCMTGLKYQENDEDEGEEISIYGVEKNSEYVQEKISSDGVCISDGFAEKYGLEKGDTVDLKESYGKKKYQFKIKGIISYPGSLCIFMERKEFNKKFELDEEYFNGYFSNKKLDKIDDSYVASLITKDDLTKVSRQLDVSMGNMFYMINVFAVALAALLIYLLTKLIIERNTTSISMVKILGYENGEIAKLYLIATTWVVVLSIGISLFVSTWFIDLIYKAIMKDYSGWLTFYVKPSIYGQMFVIVMIVYCVVALLQFRKIQKIPMDEALKNVE